MLASLPRCMLPRVGEYLARVPFEIQPQWLAAQQRCGDTAVNIAKGADTKFNLYLERLGEPNSRKGVQVQDFSISQATMIQFAENFRFAFPSQITWSVWDRKWRQHSKSMLWSNFSSPSWGNMLENQGSVMFFRHSQNDSNDHNQDLEGLERCSPAHGLNC